MQFLVRAYDGEGMLEKRMEIRPRHLEGMAKLGKHIVCAGGLLDDEGKIKGSALVMEFEDREGLQAYLDTEPYIAEHIWEKVEVDTMNVVILDGAKVGK
ncbi:MAG: YciI family protein [Clostridium sp.]|nr:YciI family protein [Clostridium sp.]